MGEVPKGDWMESVQLVFDYFCERTPRSFVETRETSVVWNYKYADNEFGRIQVCPCSGYFSIQLLTQQRLHSHSCMGKKQPCLLPCMPQTPFTLPAQLLLMCTPAFQLSV